MAAEAAQRWCEYCRDYFPVNHYDVLSFHRVGVEYGPSGLMLWKLQEALKLAVASSPPADWQARLLAILEAVPGG
jgi:hypothetical protein